jgi:hypothetical protein
VKTELEPKLRPRMQQAVRELEDLVRQRYPEATFHVSRSPEDPRIIHLMTTVDVPDTTEVVEAVLDRVLRLQLDEKLPIHVVPIRPRERVLEMLRAEQQTRPRAARSSSPQP